MSYFKAESKIGSTSKFVKDQSVVSSRISCPLNRSLELIFQSLNNKYNCLDLCITSALSSMFDNSIPHAWLFRMYDNDYWCSPQEWHWYTNSKTEWITLENKEECEHLEIVKRMNLNNGSSHE